MNWKKKYKSTFWPLKKKNVFLISFLGRPLSGLGTNLRKQFWTRIPPFLSSKVSVRVKPSFKVSQNRYGGQNLSGMYFFGIFFGETSFEQTIFQKFLISPKQCWRNGCWWVVVGIKCMDKAYSEIPDWNSYLSSEISPSKKISPKTQIFWWFKRVCAAETSPLCLLSNCGGYPHQQSWSGALETSKNVFPVINFPIFGWWRHFRELVSAEILGRFWPRLSSSKSLRSKLAPRLIWEAVVSVF